MGSKYSSELKEEPNHNLDATSTSFTKVESTSVLQFLNCWRCIRFRPINFKSSKRRMFSQNLNSDKSFKETAIKDGNDNHAMHIKGGDEEERWNENRVEIYQNNQNVVLAESNVSPINNDQNSFQQWSFKSKKPSIISLSQKKLCHTRRSISLKSCKASFGNSINNNNNDDDKASGSSLDLKKSFFSRLMSLSVDCKHRHGYVKQVDVDPSNQIFGNRGRTGDAEDAEEDKSENDELLDHGRYSCERQPDFIHQVDSMEYFDSTPSTDDKFNETSFRFQSRTDNHSSELYEESCLDNLESFCDKSILLASMDTIDLGSSSESLLPECQESVTLVKSSDPDLEGYVLLDINTYISVLEELKTCKEILNKLESLISEIDLQHQQMAA